jgi:hypothetical protein
MPTDVMQGRGNFFVGELGAAAGLSGLVGAGVLLVEIQR